MYPNPSRFIADSELVATLMKQSISIPCYRDCVLFRQGDAPRGMYILESGATTLSTKSPDRGFVIVLHSTPSLLLDLAGVVHNESHSLTAVAHRGAHVSFIERKEFMGLIESDAISSMKILRMLATGVNMARKEIVQPPLVESEPFDENSGQSRECPISNLGLPDPKPRRMLDW